MDQLSLFGAPPEPPRLPDRTARERIGEDLDTNLLVEAGAGAGKTTEMVRRMVALVRSGRAEVQQIAAVTFTRKAAGELRERFQTALERALQETLDGGETSVAERLDRALREIDRAFLGTIHGFCARLLRERPLDAGLDPAFRETLGAEEAALRARFWQSHLERLAAAGDPLLAELRELGLSPAQLYRLFGERVEQPDVEYPAEAWARPTARVVRRRIEELMDRAQSLMPAEEPAAGFDELQKTIRRLRFHRHVLGWKRDTTFLDVIGALRPGSFKLVQKRWPNGPAAKQLGGELAALFETGCAADRLLREWWAHRYPFALAFTGRAAQAYEQERVRAGRLDFQDLLLFAAHLLRESPAARRELGERYRYLLVDEFQDTDPIQAEVLFLLASDQPLEDLFDGTADDRRKPFASWQYLVPRAGALFVVGDPKQSIYRFRRADMTLYQQVKRRFAEWSALEPPAGAVLELVANFRSRQPIETFVNEIFERRFPPQATDEQASFAPMRVQPRARPALCEGVFWYELDDPVHGRVDQLAAEDAARLATWIGTRIADGRRPGDFLLLTPNTRRLAEYARALEARGVPVQVTGAGVSEQEELHELRLLLRALADPGDATLTLAALVGLFFGLDYEQLSAHALGEWTGGAGAERAWRLHQPFAFTRVLEDSDSPVEAALRRLNEYWRITRAEPADVAIGRIVDRLALLPFAAACDLGASRAGALLFALDAARATARAGDASLAGALAALEAALEEDESEAPLEPEQANVVRVMNLHKAKGLEANVVVLAMPFGYRAFPAVRRVVRDGTGRALGYTRLTEPRGQNQEQPLARPLDWDEHEAIEERFARAETERLLYVAATRAAEELVVGCAYNPNSVSLWRPFYGWLKERGTPLQLPPASRPERPRLETPPAEIAARIAAVDAERAARAAPTYRAAGVTARKAELVRAGDAGAEAVLEPASDPLALTDRRLRGTEWGTAVHAVLEAAAAGADEVALRRAARAALIGLARPMDASGEPAEIGELIAVVGAVRASPLWQRALAAPHRLIEVPFAVALSGAEYAALATAAAGGERASAPGGAAAAMESATLAAAAPVEIVDGRIDLVFGDESGWTVVDYKSDAAGARVAPDVLERYRSQVRLYAAVWERITGQPVRERVLLFTGGTAPEAVPS
ncbi:MAG TPA: UvrD-helicase domain-containing protein [Longimicrobiales bacterium]|nr:UvrD-helicase domain-containing protein [Longimicrobiales bacterium]